MQDYTDFELLIIDDCSTDETASLISRFDDPRIRFLRNEHNLGAEGNWNRCLELAQGKYFLLLPGDDLLYPGALQKRVAVLQDDVEERFSFCFCARSVIDVTDRKILNVSFFRTGIVDRKRLLKKNILAGMNVIGEPAAGLIRKKFADRAGAYSQQLPYVIDLDYWVRLLEFGDAYYINEALCAFRVTSHNWSSRLARQRFANYRDIIRKIAQLPHAETGGMTVTLGIARAWLNERLRKIFYLLFRR